MTTLSHKLLTLFQRQAKTCKTPYLIDQAFELEINGSTQQIRMCAEQSGLPPILIVQAGPGLPLLHEVKKFQKHLNLEKEFMVFYWDQRGCGIASHQDAKSVSLLQQVEDLRAILLWLKNNTRQAVTLLGISLGATIALQAAEYENDKVKAVVAISPDLHTANSDASVYNFIRAKISLSSSRQFHAKLHKLGDPPYIDSAKFQLRASILADLGVIEYGKRFSGLLQETLLSLILTYGFFGTVRALRNMNLIQRRLLPQLVSLNLLAKPPTLAVPAYIVFGGQDPFIPAEIIDQLPPAITRPKTTLMHVPDAGHMVHFDQPCVIRSIVISTKNTV